jgi:CheY-like chemotaxis protein
MMRGRGMKAGGRSILLAEDDEMVRGMARGLFHSHGWTVIEAAGLKQALAAGKRLDLLLTDAVMPDMNGRGPAP